MDQAWTESKKLGDAFEERCVRLLKNWPGVEKVNWWPQVNRREYDFSFVTTADNRWHTVECKCDVQSVTTGNAFIQTGKDGKKHGLMITTAAFWFFNLGDPLTGRILVLRPVKLHALLAGLIRAGEVRRVDAAGRSANTTGYLVPLAVLQKCPDAWEYNEKEMTNG